MQLLVSMCLSHVTDFLVWLVPQVKSWLQNILVRIHHVMAMTAIGGSVLVSTCRPKPFQQKECA